VDGKRHRLAVGRSTHVKVTAALPSLLNPARFSARINSRQRTRGSLGLTRPPALRAGL
jgi:hypothetical protein